MVMYPFYIFLAALILFLLYNYRQVIKEKLGYHDSETILTQPVRNLQLELRGTADAIIEQFQQEHQRMEMNLIKAAQRISELESLIQRAEIIQQHAAEKSKFPTELEKLYPDKIDDNKQPKDQRIRIVSQMAEHGMDVFEISQATGLGYSEVRLLLNIGRSKPEAAGSRESGIVNREKEKEKDRE